MLDDLRLFALSESRTFGQSVADVLGQPLSDHVERDFPDGEHKVRSAVNVRGRDVFVIQSLYGDEERSINDKLCRLLFFLGALRDAAAARITAVIPYLCYQRKDRKSQPRDPVTTRYLASCLESVGVDRVLTMDVHTLAAFQNAFRCGTDHLEARPLFVDRLLDTIRDANVVVLSPDEGGVKRVNRFAEGLQSVLDREVPTAFVEKLRAEGVVSGGTLVGEVRERDVIIVDDLISTGTTIEQAVHACTQNGARSIYAAATHGLFVGDADEKIAVPALESLFVTNTIPPFRLSGTEAADKVTVCDAAPRFAEAIRAIHEDGSVTRLNEME